MGTEVIAAPHTNTVTSNLEAYFAPFRKHIIGIDQAFESPYGKKHILYADWIASGRMYAPIEQKMRNTFGPFVGNTHTETSVTGTSMTHAYHDAQAIIKAHVNAGPDDVLIATGTGMTGAICKFQRILGLAVPDQLRPFTHIPEALRPVVFITHMEHHSNQTSWLETLAEVVVLDADDRGLVNVNILRTAIQPYADRPVKIGSFTACSNVTGIATPYHELARVMHEHGGLCFVDFAASAPYVDINMHPADPLEKLDAVFFSPHKFLGGPGTPGILIFDRHLYKNTVPDQPGGGTVNWTNPWGEHSYIADIEAREDGGTPGFLQTIRAALAIRLKEQMGTDHMLAREEELLHKALPALRAIPGLHILADAIEERLGILSFYIDNVHYNLVVKLLNDRYGIQVRGGCSCAGTYGHFLLHVDRDFSKRITEQIDSGDLSDKPGWVRLSLHPTMTDAELDYVLDAIRAVALNAEAWSQHYQYCSKSNEYTHRSKECVTVGEIQSWFVL